MNQTIQELYSRKSVRVFTDEPITAEEREQILLSAMQAPTAGNQQMYTILDIQSQERKEALADLCDHQPFIAAAKLVLVFLADYQKWYDVFQAAGCEPRKPREGDLLLAVTDACIAAQNAVTASESLGIGSCYIGDIMENCEAVRGLLNLPEYTFPCAMVVFGRPTEQQRTRQKPERFAPDQVVCVDAYQKKSDAALLSMFVQRAQNKPVEAWLQAFCSRKYNSAFSREMSRSVAEYLRSWAPEDRS